MFGEYRIKYTREVSTVIPATEYVVDKWSLVSTQDKREGDLPWENHDFCFRNNEMVMHVIRTSRYVCTYWNQGYGYQQGYGPGYGGSDYSPHGYYGYGPGYYYRPLF
ncbi:Mucin-21 [Manis pentadactyla]|nr:Mucin-21 [Manis pentadactyla]